MTLKLIRFPEMKEKIKLSRSTVWRLERQGVFPKSRRISANTVGWLESEVDAWIKNKFCQNDIPDEGK